MTTGRACRHQWFPWENGKELDWRTCRKCGTDESRPHGGEKATQCDHEWGPWTKTAVWERSLRSRCTKCLTVRTSTAHSPGGNERLMSRKTLP
jgi:hypothetical protein